MNGSREAIHSLIDSGHGTRTCSRPIPMASLCSYPQMNSESRTIRDKEGLRQSDSAPLRLPLGNEMRIYSGALFFCLLLSGCERGSHAVFSEIQLPIARNAHTYHGPGGESVITINEKNTLRLETPDGNSYVDPTHDAAVKILRSARIPNRPSRVHIFFDRRAAVLPIIRAYEMIEGSQIEAIFFAGYIDDNSHQKDSSPLYALSFRVPSPEIRAQRKPTNP